MSEQPNDEYLNAVFVAANPEMASERVHSTVKRVDLSSIIVYAAAYFGSWIVQPCLLS